MSQNQNGLSDISDPGASSKKLGATVLIVLGLALLAGMYLLNTQKEVAKSDPSMTDKSYNMSSKEAAIPDVSIDDVTPFIEFETTYVPEEPIPSSSPVATDARPQKKESWTQGETIPGSWGDGPEEAVTGDQEWRVRNAQTVREEEKSLSVPTTIFQSGRRSGRANNDTLSKDDLQKRRDDAVAARMNNLNLDPQSTEGIYAALNGTIPGAVSSQWHGPRNQVVGIGTKLPCVLETPMNSSLPGITRCVIAGDVYTDTGAHLVIPRGSQVVGEYRAKMNRGVKRMFVIWNRLLTPQGVTVSLGSPGSGPMGESGIEAEMDHHFFQRFGSSILLSMIGGLAATESDNGTGVAAASAASFSESAGIALKDSIGIPSTGRVEAGRSISILVAKDIDFRETLALMRVSQ